MATEYCSVYSNDELTYEIESLSSIIEKTFIIVPFGLPIVLIPAICLVMYFTKPIFPPKTVP